MQGLIQAYFRADANVPTHQRRRAHRILCFPWKTSIRWSGKSPAPPITSTRQASAVGLYRICCGPFLGAPVHSLLHPYRHHTVTP